jgi:hypothetical protein
MIAFPASPPSPDGDMVALQGGFDGGASPDDRRRQTLWRVGRWLRAQGSVRPTALRRAEDGLIIVNGQILTIGADGEILNLSTTRRPGARAPGAQGCLP